MSLKLVASRVPGVCELPLLVVSAFSRLVSTPPMLRVTLRRRSMYMYSGEFSSFSAPASDRRESANNRAVNNDQ